jgi:hypothetical protein
MTEDIPDFFKIKESSLTMLSFMPASLVKVPTPDPWRLTPTMEAHPYHESSPWSYESSF